MPACATTSSCLMTFALVMTHPLSAACVCVCTLWTLALAHRKGQARRAAIICPCVMLGHLQLFGGGVVSLRRAFLVSKGRRAHGCGTFHPAGVENGASSARARPAPQVWQCRWEQQSMPEAAGSSRDRAAPLQLANNNNSSALHERSDELIKVTTLISSSLTRMIWLLHVSRHLNWFKEGFFDLEQPTRAGLHDSKLSQDVKINIGHNRSEFRIIFKRSRRTVTLICS